MLKKIATLGVKRTLLLSITVALAIAGPLTAYFVNREVRQALEHAMRHRGESDARVPYPQGQQLYRALTTLGVPTEFVHYPREGHAIREYRHRADYYARILKWFDRWIR